MPPGGAFGRIGPTAHQVDHGHAVDEDAQRRTDFATLGEVPDEFVAHGAEAGVTMARDRDVHGSDSVPVVSLMQAWDRGRRPETGRTEFSLGCLSSRFGQLAGPLPAGGEANSPGRATTRPSTFPLSSARRSVTASVAHDKARNAAASSSFMAPPWRPSDTTLSSVSTPPYPCLGRHEIALGRHVQAHRCRHPFPQRSPHGARRVGGVRFVGASGQQVADVVHQPRRRQFVVARMEMGQQRRRLEGVVELGDGEPGTERGVDAGGQHFDDAVHVEVGHGLTHRLLLVPYVSMWRPFSMFLVPHHHSPRCKYGGAPCPGPHHRAVRGPTK